MTTKIEQATITIIGDRQTGKSYLLGLAALDAAQAGESVLYQCESRLMVTERFRELRAASGRCARIPAKASRANGSESIEWSGGGRILFGVGEGRGLVVDLHILDGVDAPEHPTATRVIKARLA